MTKTLISIEIAKEYISQLDLSYIINAMCSSEYPLPKWTTSDAAHCAMLYKNFLWLHKKHPSIFFVPTKEIDEFWHNHILYTKNYHQDCLQIFGHYLHHEPANPNENPGPLIDAYLQTKQLYLEEFGHPIDQSMKRP